MPRLTERAHEAVRAVLRPGEVAIDATAGNGHDTRFLADCVGSAGLVFAFDIQSHARVRTAESVHDCSHVTILDRDHAEMRDALSAELHGRVGAVMFNLGYLPGGDKTIITRTPSTLRAITAATELLRPGGVLTVVAYPGHKGGAEEAGAVAALLGSLPAIDVTVREVADEGVKPTAPRLFVVHKRAAPG